MMIVTWAWSSSESFTARVLCSTGSLYVITVICLFTIVPIALVQEMDRER